MSNSHHVSPKNIDSKIMSLANEKTKEQVFNQIKSIISATMPALYRTGDPGAFKTDALTRLKILFEALVNPATQKNHLKILIQQIAQVFDLNVNAVTEQVNGLMNINELIEPLYNQLEQLFDLNKATIAKHILGNLTQVYVYLQDIVLQLPALFDEEMKQYLKRQTPKLLAERQEQAQKKIDESGVDRRETRKIPNNMVYKKDSIGFGSKNIQYFMPANWQDLRIIEFKPPQMFVDTIMNGGYIVFNKPMSLFENPVIPVITDKDLQSIKKKTVNNELSYSNIAMGIAYGVGYLSEVKASDSKVYNMDLHLNGFRRFKLGELTIAEYGDIIWQGKKVTQAFWDRLEKIYQTGVSAKIEGFTVNMLLPEYQLNENLFLYPYKSSDNRLLEKKTNLGLLRIGDSDNDTYIDSNVVTEIAQIISSTSSKVLYQIENARILLDTVQDPKYYRYGSKSRDEKVVYITDEEEKNYFRKEKFSGKQGEVIDQALQYCHSRFDFLSPQALENAIDILTDPVNIIIDPLDIIVRENTIYLAGPVNDENLKLAAAKKSKDRQVLTVTQVEEKAVAEPVDSRSVSDILSSYFSQFISNHINQAHQFVFEFIFADDLEKDKTAIQLNLLKAAIKILVKAADVEKEAKLTQEIRGQSITMTLEVPDSVISKFKAGITPRKNNARILEFAHAAVSAVDLLGKKDVIQHAYVSSAPALVPYEAIKAYQMRLLEVKVFRQMTDVTVKDSKRSRNLLNLRPHSKVPTSNLMLQAIRNEAYDTIKMLIEDYHVDVTSKDYLYEAAIKKNVEIMKLLLKHGAYIGKLNAKSLSALREILQSVAKKQDVENIRLLLVNYDVNPVPASLAGQGDYGFYVLKDIDKALYSITQISKLNYTEDEVIELAKLAIAKGASANFNESLCLSIAIQLKQYKLAALFVENGANYDDSSLKLILTPEDKMLVEACRVKHFVTSQKDEKHIASSYNINQQVILNVLSFAMPALLKTDNPNDFFVAIQMKLVQLLTLYFNNKHEYELVFIHASNVFGLTDSKNQDDFRQAFTLLTQEINQASVANKTTIEVAIQSHFSEKFNINVDVAFKKYQTESKPKILAERQAQVKKKIDDYPEIKSAKRGIKDGQKQKETDYDFLIYINNRCYQIPGNYYFYADRNWVPPKRFIKDIMEGGNFQVGTAGMGTFWGYRFEDKISDTTLEKIKQNTYYQHLYYEKGAPYLDPENTDYIRRLPIGNLRTVTAPDGKEYDVDFYKHNKLPAMTDATLATYGSIIYKGKDVTKEFWERVKSLTLPCDNNNEKSETARRELKADYYKTYLEKNIPTKPATQFMMVAPKKNNEAESNRYVTKVNIDKSRVNRDDGLAAHYESYLVTVEPQYQSMLQDITAAINLTAVEPTPSNAQLVIQSNSALNVYSTRNISDSYINAYNGRYYFDAEKESRIFKYKKPVNYYDVERELGVQGRFADTEILFAHTKLDFSTRKDLENAIDGLTIPGKEVVLPGDIFVRGNSIYLRGYVNLGRLFDLHEKLPHKRVNELVMAKKPQSYSHAHSMHKKRLRHPIKLRVENANKVLMPVIDKLGLRHLFQIVVVKKAALLIFPIDKAISSMAQLAMADMVTQFFNSMKTISGNKINFKVEIVQGSIQVALDTESLNRFTEIMTQTEHNQRVIAGAFVELIAVQSLIKKALQLDCRQEESLGNLTLHVNELLPVDYLKQYYHRAMLNVLNKQLKQAVANNQIEDIKILVRMGADPTQAIFTALARTVELSVLACLLDLKANVEGDKTDADLDWYDTPLMIAAKLGDYDKAAILIDHGADMSAKKSDADTALVISAVHGENPKLTELLLDKGGVHEFSDKSTKDKKIKDVDEVLMYITRFQDKGATLRLIDKLVEKGANVNYFNTWSVLQRAISSGGLSSPVSQKLIEHGARYNFDDILPSRGRGLEFSEAEDVALAIHKNPKLSKILPSIRLTNGNQRLLHLLIMLSSLEFEKINFDNTFSDNRDDNFRRFIVKIRLIQLIIARLWLKDDEIDFEGKDEAGKTALELLKEQAQKFKEKIDAINKPDNKVVIPQDKIEYYKWGLAQCEWCISELERQIQVSKKMNTALQHHFSPLKKAIIQGDKIEITPEATQLIAQGKRLSYVDLSFDLKATEKLLRLIEEHAELAKILPDLKNDESFSKGFSIVQRTIMAIGVQLNKIRLSDDPTQYINNMSIHIRLLVCFMKHMPQELKFYFEFKANLTPSKMLKDLRARAVEICKPRALTFFADKITLKSTLDNLLDNIKVLETLVELFIKLHSETNLQTVVPSANVATLGWFAQSSVQRISSEMLSLFMPKLRGGWYNFGNGEFALQCDFESEAQDLKEKLSKIFYNLPVRVTYERQPSNMLFVTLGISTDVDFSKVLQAKKNELMTVESNYKPSLSLR
jgi:ankyrin repeat protein